MESGKTSCIRIETHSEQVSTTATLVVAGVFGLDDEWHFHSKDLTLQTAWCLSSRDISLISCAVNWDAKENLLVVTPLSGTSSVFGHSLVAVSLGRTPSSSWQKCWQSS